MNINKVVEIINEKGYQAEVKEFVKGSTTKMGIVIGTGNIRPTIYPEQFTGTDEEIADKVIEVYEKVQVSEFDIDKLTDVEHIKQNAFVAVRRPMDDGAFVKEYLDIQLVIRIKVYTNPEKTASYILHKDLAEKLNFDETIFDEAIKNMKFEFEPLASILGGFLGADDIPDCGQYVLSNNERLFGASAIFSKGCLKSIANMLDSDLVIIPSSTNELIVMKKEPDMDLNALDEMVKEVNTTQVPPEDQLSDHVYIYHKEDDTITF